METSKEKAIKAAYGELYKKYEDRINKNDGYLNYKSEKVLKEIRSIVGEVELHPHYVYIFRPMSLQGLENNNGWTRIESEEDLPKEYGPYHVKYENGQTVSWFNGVDFITLTGRKYKEDAITHYQQIEIPKPPIF